jgi:Fe/S biogenesis protein NfuA
MKNTPDDSLTPMTQTLTEPVLSVTDEALAKILELRAAEDEPDTLGLRVAITGERGAEYIYDLSFEPLAESDDDDLVHQQGELPVVVPADSVDSLRGATLDLPRNREQLGLVLRNPNKPNPLGNADIELTGDLAQTVAQLLDQMINPALAMHGGFTELKGVEDDRVYILMGGGCQGCAISAMTLRDGIDRTIREHIPEVGEIVDVTDHEAGENPYFT